MLAFGACNSYFDLHSAVQKPFPRNGDVDFIAVSRKTICLAFVRFKNTCNRRFSEGSEAQTIGRKCVCNGLLSTVGLAQVRGAVGPEPALITAGDDVAHIARFLKPGRDSYSVDDVLDRLLTTGDSQCHPST